ncbi:MAG: type II toxin-antitoxin system HicB family antitoxin [Chloroflexi bacterium]|nr:type II toxin-antitoxin system HicB family antitoxin [Chloroflexota bacterium]
MKELKYAIILHPEPEDGGYSVSVPTLPGCYTQGETLEEAIANAKEAIQVYVESLIADGEPVPEESEHPQALVISVAA